jgi:hypothetical protein
VGWVLAVLLAAAVFAFFDKVGDVGDLPGTKALPYPGLPENGRQNKQEHSARSLQANEHTGKIELGGELGK